MLTQLNSLNLPWPTDWAAVFDAERPLILEIGFGYSQMLDYLQRTRPDSNIVGLEISNFCIERAEKFITRENWHNVRVVRSHAETALHHLFIPASLREIHVNFPDPWFKERHAGRRLMQRDTLDAMTSRLAPGGMLYLATDILPYAEMSHALLNETPGLMNMLAAPWANAYADRVTTKYEKKARAAGRDCYYFAYRRNHAPAPDVPVMEERPMPHIVMHSPLDLNTLYEKLLEHREETGSYGAIHTKLINVYIGERALLFDVYISEPTIDQRTGLVLVQRDDPGEYILKIGNMGNPRPTDGLHRAVGMLGEMILGLHPESSAIHDRTRPYQT